MLKIDPSIARATLKILAKYQGKTVDSKSEEEPGKILHEHRFSLKQQKELSNWKFPYYGSVDSTPLFIVLATQYLKKTNDRAFLLKIMDNVLAAHGWIKNYGDVDGDGYVEYERKNPYGLFHQGWKDGITDHLRIKPPVAIVEVQGYVYAAYQSLVFLMKRLGRKIPNDMHVRMQTLKENFNRDFWMEDKNFFALALDGEKKQRKVVTSNPGHLLFTGIVSRDRVKTLISRLFKPDLWTPYGVRNHSSMEPDFDPYNPHLGCIWPHDNWIVYKGLQKLGFTMYANKIREALLRAYKKLGKIPEFYTVVDNQIVDLSTSSSGKISSNPLQAWASAGLLDMAWAC
jgi:glycogen debranching enzyme